MSASSSLPRGARARLRALIDLATGPAGSWISLAVGIVSSVLWRGGVDVVRASMVVGSIAGVATTLAILPHDAAGERAGRWRRRAHRFVGWTTPNLAKNALWFVMPFYVISTSWWSLNAPFTLLLAGLGVLSCFERTMRDVVLRRPAAAAGFVAVTQLAALQLFLPVLTGVSPRHTIAVSGALATASALPVLRRRASPGTRAAGTVLVASLLGGVLARLVLPLLAPAPLRLASVTFSLERRALDPGAPLAAIPDRECDAYVFVSVEAPRGLHESVRLEIEQDARSSESRPLAISGGRRGGYRLWSALRLRPGAPLVATVRTAGGQLVGSARLAPGG